MSNSAPTSLPPPGPINKRIESLKTKYENVKHPSEVKLISVTRSTQERNLMELTKAEVFEYVNDPFWRTVRRVLLGGTIVTFIVFFVSAITLIYFKADCITSGSVRLNITNHTSE